MQRLGNLVRRVFVPRAKHERGPVRGECAAAETRDATEAELDEALDESFPASDPVALHLEKDR